MINTLIEILPFLSGIMLGWYLRNDKYIKDTEFYKYTLRDGNHYIEYLQKQLDKSNHTNNKG